MNKPKNIKKPLISLNNIDSRREARYRPIGIIFTNVCKKTGRMLNIVSNFTSTLSFVFLLFLGVPVGLALFLGFGAPVGGAVGLGCVGCVGCLGPCVGGGFLLGAAIFILNKYFIVRTFKLKINIKFVNYIKK